MWAQISIAVGVLLIGGYYVLEYRAQKEGKGIGAFARAIEYRKEIFIASGVLIIGGIGFLLYQQRMF